MDSVRVRNSIAEIYDRFIIPSNLRLHMYRVASVAEMICDSLPGASVNNSNVVAACLLHDLGNIVKFDLKSDSSAGLLCLDGKDLDYWLEVKKDMTARYGAVDHVATHNMLSELGVDARLMSMMDNMGRMFGSGSAAGNGDLEADICGYSDCRVGPDGVQSVTDRITAFYERCKRSENATLRARGLELFSGLGRILDTERRIFSDASISPDQIDDKSIKPYLDRYMKH